MEVNSNSSRRWRRGRRAPPSSPPSQRGAAAEGSPAAVPIPVSPRPAAEAHHLSRARTTSAVVEEEKKECSPANEHAIVKEERDVGGEDDANEHVVAKKYTNDEENGDLVVKNNFCAILCSIQN